MDTSLGEDCYNATPDTGKDVLLQSVVKDSDLRITAQFGDPLLQQPGAPVFFQKT